MLAGIKLSFAGWYFSEFASTAQWPGDLTKHSVRRDALPMDRP
jgi:hypothetical protein